MEKEPEAIRFGMMAVKKGFVTPEDVVEALKIQESEECSAGQHRPIGRILSNEGHITLQQVGEVLRSMGKMDEKKVDKTFGDVAVEKGFITENQIEEALKIQTDDACSTGERRPVGRILINEGFMTLQQVGEVLKSLEKPER